MFQNIHTDSIPVGQLGVLSVNLPKLTLTGRQEGKKVLILAGQHGNEVTPLFVLRKLLADLDVSGLSAGALTILTVTNPLGLLFDLRRDPVDDGNLNRLWPGKTNKDFSKRLVAAIWPEVEKTDLVIDLHTFSRQCGVVGVLLKSGDEVEQKSRQAILAFGPDCVWQIDMQRDEDSRFAGTLEIAAARQGVPVVTFEMERHLTIKEEGIDRVVNGLKNVLVQSGLIDAATSNTKPKKEIPIYHGTYLYFDQSGIFIPEKRPFDQVEVGTRLGTVTDLITFEDKSVISPISGTLLTIRFRDFVRTGTKLGSVGALVGTLT